MQPINNRQRKRNILSHSLELVSSFGVLEKSMIRKIDEAVLIRGDHESPLSIYSIVYNVTVELHANCYIYSK